MATILSNTPSRRSGTNPRKNQQNEFQARNMATDWARRNIDLASREELVKTRDALLRCGVVVSSIYSAPARLLSRITQQLDNPAQ